MKKRNQKPEVRKAQREQAIRAAKEVKKAKVQSKKPSAASAATKKQQVKAQQPKAAKQPTKAPAKVSGLR
jgi:large subunit ribosomal protein L24e